MIKVSKEKEATIDNIVDKILNSYLFNEFIEYADKEEYRYVLASRILNDVMEEKSDRYIVKEEGVYLVPNDLYQNYTNDYIKVSRAYPEMYNAIATTNIIDSLITGIIRELYNIYGSVESIMSPLILNSNKLEEDISNYLLHNHPIEYGLIGISVYNIEDAVNISIKGDRNVTLSMISIKSDTIYIMHESKNLLCNLFHRVLSDDLFDMICKGFDVDRNRVLNEVLRDDPYRKFTYVTSVDVEFRTFIGSLHPIEISNITSRLIKFLNESPEFKRDVLSAMCTSDTNEPLLELLLEKYPTVYIFASRLSIVCDKKENTVVVAFNS